MFLLFTRRNSLICRSCFLNERKATFLPQENQCYMRNIHLLAGKHTKHLPNSKSTEFPTNLSTNHFSIRQLDFSLFNSHLEHNIRYSRTLMYIHHILIRNTGRSFLKISLLKSSLFTPLFPHCLTKTQKFHTQLHQNEFNTQKWKYFPNYNRFFGTYTNDL